MQENNRIVDNVKLDFSEELKMKLLKVIDYIKKANENFIAVNEGMEAPHPGVSLRKMKQKINNLIETDELRSLASDGSKEKRDKIISLLKEIEEQNPSTTGYNSDTVEANVKKLEKIVYD